MKMHVLQHESFESEAGIGDWARARGHEITRTRLYKNETLPANCDAYDWLVIMGGSMNIYEEKKFPWLGPEKAFIREALTEGRVRVLGICLGAQLMSDTLGGPVTRNPVKEIGWFPVEQTEAGRACPHFSKWPERFLAFHWHGDTFTTPAQATRAIQSDACANQAIIFGDRAVGLQFHLDYTSEGIAAMIKNCGGDIIEGCKFVQVPEVMAMDIERRVLRTQPLLHQLLESLEAVS